MKIEKLCNFTPKEILTKKAFDCAQATLIKVMGIAIKHLFKNATNSHLSFFGQGLGSIIQGYGSVLISNSVAEITMYVLEHNVSEQHLNPYLKIGIKITKYALPILTGLATCLLIYGTNLIALGIVAMYAIDTTYKFRKAFHQPAPSA